MRNTINRLMGVYLNSLAFIREQKAKEAAFALFCRPFRTPITDKQKQFFNTAEKFTFEHDDTPIQGYRWGTGEKKIVFFHGWQSHTYRWKTYIDRLPKDEYTIYSIDAPGHGLSSGKFLTVPLYGSIIGQFLISIGDAEAVVAHSLGSFSLLYAFHVNPLLPVRKIVLMAPPGEADDFVAVYRKTLGLSDKVIELIGERFLELYDVRPADFSSAKYARALNVAGLIIHDEADAEAPYRYGQRLHSMWPKSRLITPQGLGHNLKSSTVVDHVVNYLSDELAEAPFPGAHATRTTA